MTYQRDFKERLNVGVIGAGHHSYRNMIPVLHFLPVKLRAVCDLNESTAKLTAEEYGAVPYTGIQEMFKKEKLDAVFICVSPSMHPKLAIEALDAGLHVYTEKPVAMNASQVEEMIKHRKDRVVVTGFKKAFMPSTDKAVEIINSPDFGGLRTILCNYGSNLPQDKSADELLKGDKNYDWLDHSCHPLAVLVRTGGKVATVQAHTTKDGWGMVVLEYVNGVMGFWHHTHSPYPQEFYNFYGNKWRLMIDNCWRVTLQRGVPLNYGYSLSYMKPGVDTGAVVWEPNNSLATLENKQWFMQGVYPEMKYFCDCILNKQKPEHGSLEFALELMKIFEATLRSKGAKIKIS